MQKIYSLKLDMNFRFNNKYNNILTIQYLFFTINIYCYL